MPTFQRKLTASYNGSGKLPPEMTQVEILKETGMSFTEQNKQPTSFIELIILDIQIKRQVEAAKAKRRERRRRGRYGH